MSTLIIDAEADRRVTEAERALRPMFPRPNVYLAVAGRVIEVPDRDPLGRSVLELCRDFEDLEDLMSR